MACPGVLLGAGMLMSLLMLTGNLVDFTRPK